MYLVVNCVSLRTFSTPLVMVVLVCAVHDTHVVGMALCMLLYQESSSSSSSSSVRQLTQCHCTEWDDHCVPNEVDGVFDMVDELRNHIKSADNPVLVHCRWVMLDIAVLVCLQALHFDFIPHIPDTMDLA